MTNFEAVPTEYRGVRYRSKCEAMFARWLELSQGVGVDDEANLPGGYAEVRGFIYEPEWLEVDGWKPDFLCWHIHGGRDYSLHFSRDLIEYKPKKPTDAYLDAFKTKAKLLQQTGKVTTSRLFFGSVFSKQRGCFYYFPSTDSFTVSQFDWIGDYEQDLKSYRYDLVGTHA